MSEKQQLQKTIATVEAQRASLGDAAVDAVLAGLRRQLAELEAAQENQWPQTVEQTTGGERRVVTVLMCDVKGSTAMAEKLDPETWTEIMDEAFDYLSEPVDRFGGTVAQLLGDGILAFFGAPKAHEDDPQRAVLAGLAIIQNIQSFHEKLRQERGMDFNVRVGINTGLVIFGRIGAKGHEEFQVLGDGVNLATRMEEEARPGTVQVSEYTYKFVANIFDFEEATAVDLPGRDRQMRAYRVIRRRAEAGPDRGLNGDIAMPLIGRDREMAAARTAVSRLLHRKGGILYITGEAGIGKSRLLTELQARSRGENLTWLIGRTLFYGQSISFWPFQDILRQLTGIQEDDGESDAWAKLERNVQLLFGDESDEILPYLAGILALEAHGKYRERVKYLDGEAMRDQILVATPRYFERLAEKRPLVLVFEDSQWIDASSVALLERLFPLVKKTRLLICGTSRPELNTAAERLHQLALRDYADSFTEINLAPLPNADSVQLVHNILARDNLSIRAQEMIVAKADGNPFYLEEIMRDLIEEGAMTQVSGNGHWRATARINAIHIPDTIQGVIAARIDRLDDAVKRVLRAAAVIGHSFSLQILAAVMEREPALEQHLAALETAELIRVKQRMPEVEYLFLQSLAQEVAYKRILLQKRRSLHAKVGQAIESLFADRLEEFYGLLAYHYAQAEAWEPAQEYLLKAGDQAGQVAAGAEALVLYRRAQEAYENSFGQDWSPLQRAELARKMGEAYYSLGLLPESREYFQDALTLLDRPLPQSRFGLFAGLVRQVVRQTAHRMWPSRFLDSAPEEERELLREAVRSYERMGVIFYIEGEAASSVYAFLRSLNVAEPAGPSPELARAYANNVIAAAIIPPLRFMAERYSQAALEIARDDDDLAALAWVWQLTGIYHTGVGNWAEAIAAQEQAVEINKRIGRLRLWEETSGSLGQVLHLSGSYERSIAIYHEMTASGEERGDRQSQVWALAGLIETGMRLAKPGYKEEIIVYLERAQALLEEYRFPNRPDAIQTFGLLAYARLRRHEWDLARAAAKKTAELIAVEWPPSTFYTFESYAAMPVVYMGLWQAQESGQYSTLVEEDFKKLAGRACRDLRNYGRVFPIAKPRARLWQGVYEWLTEKPNKARNSWQDSLEYAERLEMPYDIGLAHYEIGRHLPLEDPARKEHLEQAQQIFADLGAGWDLERAQKALDLGD